MRNSSKRDVSPPVRGGSTERYLSGLVEGFDDQAMMRGGLSTIQETQMRSSGVGGAGFSAGMGMGQMQTNFGAAGLGGGMSYGNAGLAGLDMGMGMQGDSLNRSLNTWMQKGVGAEMMMTGSAGAMNNSFTMAGGVGTGTYGDTQEIRIRIDGGGD